jgi:curved DNA-binding protein CbpA
MLQARGPVPFDPYGILQLHPCAPRGLVVETYWMLVERATRRPRTFDAGDLASLHLAFALLTGDERRFPSFVARGDDYYALLRVDRHADADVIDLAHSVLSRTLPSRAERDALDVAHQTLSNGYRRARYDAARGGRGGLTLLTDLLRTPAYVDVTATKIAPSPRPFESRLQPVDVAAPLEERPTPVAPSRQPADAQLPLAEVELPVVEEEAADGPAVAVMVSSQPDDARTALAHVELAAAEEPAGTTWVDATGRADLEFVTGPRAGQRIAITADTLTLGRGNEANVVLIGAGVPVAPKHARVWRVRDRYVLRRLDGDDMWLNGAPLLLPAVPLEHGDEFAIGALTLRFTRGSA